MSDERSAREDDVEGHMAFRRSVTDDAEGLGEAEALDDGEGHMAFRRSVTQDDDQDASDDDAEGHARRY